MSTIGHWNFLRAHVRYTLRTIKVKRGKGFTFTVVGVVPCWPESNRKPRKARWTFLGELVHMRIVQFPSGNSLAVIRFRRCGREFSMRANSAFSSTFFFKRMGRGGRSKRREIIGRFLEKSVFSLSNLLQEMDEWPAIMREI